MVGRMLWDWKRPNSSFPYHVHTILSITDSCLFKIVFDLRELDQSTIKERLESIWICPRVHNKPEQKQIITPPFFSCSAVGWSTRCYDKRHPSLIMIHHSSSSVDRSSYCFLSFMFRYPFVINSLHHQEMSFFFCCPFLLTCFIQSHLYYR